MLNVKPTYLILVILNLFHQLEYVNKPNQAWIFHFVNIKPNNFLDKLYTGCLMVAAADAALIASLKEVDGI